MRKNQKYLIQIIQIGLLTTVYQSSIIQDSRTHDESTNNSGFILCGIKNRPSAPPTKVVLTTYSTTKQKLRNQGRSLGFCQLL